MKTLWIAAVLAAVLVTGCETPKPIEFAEDPDIVNATPLDPLSSDYSAAAIDSTGVLPRDQERVVGEFLVNQLTYDDGQNVATLTLANVRLLDKLRPVRFNNRTFGFTGLGVRAAYFNGAPMLEIPHVIRVQLPQPDTVHAGVEYVANAASLYRPGGLCTWRLSLSLNRVDSISIVAPDSIKVLAPAGGTAIPRDRDLILRWISRSPVTVVLSRVEGRASRPLAVFDASRRTGRAVIPLRVLSSLPAGPYAFTFIAANAYEIPPLLTPDGRILVQAGSLYTVFVQLRP